MGNWPVPGHGSRSSSPRRGCARGEIARISRHCGAPYATTRWPVGHALARHESRRLGQPVSGYHLFTGINTARLALGLPPALDALKPVRFGPNPVQEFQLTKLDGRLRLALRV